MIYALSFILAFLSLLYELTIAQTMAFLTTNTIVWYSLTIGLFIGSMGLGALWTQDLKKTFKPVMLLVLVEMFLALVGGGIVFLLHFGHLFALVTQNSSLAVWGVGLFFGVAILGIIVVGLLTGVEIPVLLDWAIDREEVHVSEARILGADYLGALCATLVFPLLLLPYLSLFQISYLVGFLTLVVACFLVVKISPHMLRHWIMGLTVLFLILLVLAPRIEAFFVKKYYFHYLNHDIQSGMLDASLPEGASVSRTRSPYHVIDFVRYPERQGQDLKDLLNAYRQSGFDDKELGGWELFLNGNFQFSVDAQDADHETFAYVPLAALNSNPKKILILGAGDGLLLRDILRAPFVDDVTLVELDPKMVELFSAVPLLKDLNHESLLDDRVQVVVGDAFNFVRKDKQKYDAIYIDFPAPVDYDLSKIYSREFYVFVKQRLSLGAFIAINAPGIMPVEDLNSELNVQPIWPVFFATLKAAGFDTVVPFFSRLEEDNEKAISAMERMYEGVDVVQRTEINTQTGQSRVVMIEGEREVAQEMLKEHIRQMTAGFILASPKVRSLNIKALSGSWVVQNIKRAGLSLKSGEGFERKRGRVNSLFRPQLPRSDRWFEIRSPYN